MACNCYTIPCRCRIEAQADQSKDAARKPRGSCRIAFEMLREATSGLEADDLVSAGIWARTAGSLLE